MPFLIAAIAACVGAGLFWYGFRRMHHCRMIQDTPTSTIRGMAVGIVEINGLAKSDEYLTAPYSRLSCVYCQYVVKEYRRHHSGKRTTYSWDTVDSGDMRSRFSVDDDTGEVAVNPEKAEFNVKLKKLFLQRAGGLRSILSIFTSGGRSDATEMQELDPNASSFFSWSNSVGDRKYYEYLIAPGEQVYVLGTAAIDNSAPPRHVICKGDDDFLISDRSEAELVSSMQWRVFGSFAAGVLLIAVAAVVLFHVLSADIFHRGLP